MEKNRFKVIQESKFEKLSNKDLEELKGGLCISCMKRDRKVKLGSSKSTQQLTTKYGDRIDYTSYGGTFYF
ncbi:MAG: hypothetical protein N4A49_05070 [Marinifilaceae bacterium]|jgi:hypothetical protein|nr:hypothetical protein [Marinifilaceae bacterium]